MDINRLLKAGDNACGRVLKILPEDEIGSPKKFMLEILRDETMPTVNRLMPYVYRSIINTSQLVPVKRTDMTGYVGYRIPKELTQGLSIRGIRSLHTSTTGYSNDVYRNNGAFGYIGANSWMSAAPNQYGRYSSANMYEAALGGITAYADLLLLGQLQEAPIPRFEEPNIMWINKTYGSASSFYITFLLENDANLLTVSDEGYDAVKRIFILDIKKTIYNRFGILSNIDTALGSLDLKIDDWSGAENEREELVDNYNSLSHIRKGTIIAG